MYDSCSKSTMFMSTKISRLKGFVCTGKDGDASEINSTDHAC